MPKDHDPDDSHNRDSSTMPRDRDWPEDESNPFVAFRRFADEQVSSVLQSITGLPSSVTPPQPDSWTIFTDDNGYKSMAYRQRNGTVNNAGERNYTSDRGTESTSPGDRDDTPPSNTEKSVLRPSQSRPPEETDTGHSQSRWHRHNGPSDFFDLNSFFDRFENHFFPFSSHLFRPHHRFFFPDMFEDNNSPMWPITYILFSPYSPLHLERQAHYRAHREQGVFSTIMSSLRQESDRDPAEPQWREAFEDLIRLENGKPMLDHDALVADKAENGKEWLHGLVNRGSLGDQWEYVPGTDHHPWSGITCTGRGADTRALPEKEPTKSQEDHEAAQTELDVYERFLQDIEAREREFYQGVSGSPLLRFLLEEHRRQHDERETSQRSLPHAEDEQGNEDTESWLDLVSGGKRKSVPEAPVEPTPSVEAKSADSVTATAPRVIATMSRTERVRLADGSIQTKTVETKRYADGREETDESVETTHPRTADGKSAEGKKSKNGWFWKD